jgi:hypothetical protein
MRIARELVLCLLALCLAASAAIAAPPPVADPDKYAARVMGLIAKSDMAAVAKMIADSIGKPTYADTIQNGFDSLTGKTIDYSDKVIDNTFGKSLRQIVYYTFVDQTGFVYYRFNFKMSSHGWILANFIFKSENNELFPKDFIDR